MLRFPDFSDAALCVFLAFLRGLFGLWVPRAYYIGKVKKSWCYTGRPIRCSLCPLNKLLPAIGRFIESPLWRNVFVVGKKKALLQKERPSVSETLRGLPRNNGRLVLNQEQKHNWKSVYVTIASFPVIHFPAQKMQMIPVLLRNQDWNWKPISGYLLRFQRGKKWINRAFQHAGDRGKSERDFLQRDRPDGGFKTHPGHLATR